MFLDGENLCNFADNTISKSCGSLGMAKNLVEEQCTLITDWFKFKYGCSLANSQIANSKKYMHAP